MLSSLAVKFEDVNVETEPGGWEDLRAMGIAAPPVFVLGDRRVPGWNPRAILALVDRSYAEPPPLGPAELEDRLGRILTATLRAAAQLSGDVLDAKSPHRDRTLRNLVFHVFRLSLTFPDAVAQDRCPVEWFLEDAPETMREVAALVAYGRTVRDKLSCWFDEHRHGDWDAIVRTHYGLQTRARLLERTTWHAAQHARQVYDIMRLVGITPSEPLTATDFEGLPLPDAVW